MIALFLYRQKNSLTQADLAQKLGVTSNCISQWENGQRKPNIVQLKRLANLLNCSTDDLLAPISIN